jgi:phage repressor protein C with HTH and peptisase S24 domain
MAGHVTREPSAQGLAPIYAWEHEDELPPGEYVMVPRLDVHLSAGNGKDQVEIDLSRQSPQAFRAEWIRERKFKPKRLAAMTASGNSMEPAIHHGDSLLVDTSQTEVVDGRVYALWYEGGERVKRLFRLPGGGLRIKSDNPEHGAIELGPDYTGHVRVIGRVVHRSGTGGL